MLRVGREGLTMRAGGAYLALTMSELPLPVQFLAAWIGTWLARRQERLIGYLREENRVLLERLGGKVRLTDPERRRLARIGKVVGRKGARGGGQHRDARYDPAVVSGACGEEVRRELEARTRTARDSRRDRAAARGDGDAEHEVGLHAAARRAEECRVRGGPEHDQADLEGAGDRARTAASAADTRGRRSSRRT